MVPIRLNVEIKARENGWRREPISRFLPRVSCSLNCEAISQGELRTKPIESGKAFAFRGTFAFTRTQSVMGGAKFDDGKQARASDGNCNVSV